MGRGGGTGADRGIFEKGFQDVLEVEMMHPGRPSTGQVCPGEEEEMVGAGIGKVKGIFGRSSGESGGLSGNTSSADTLKSLIKREGERRRLRSQSSGGGGGMGKRWRTWG